MIRRASPDAIAEAARLIRAGEPVAFPTETVYGLGANALDDRAVAKVFAVKRRPRFNPLIVHVPDAAEAARLVDWDERAAALAHAFWPGPLTFVLPRRSDCPVSLLAGAGLDTLAVRAPAHEVAQALLAAAEVPLAAPSANRSGEISPTSAEHVQASLGDAVALILDGGPCRVGLESTVLDLTTVPPRLLRPGGVTREALLAVVGAVAEASGEEDKSPASPGLLRSHYAPRAALRLEARAVAPDEALLAFGPGAPAGAAETLNLSPSGDLAEAAANLFAMLRRLDRPGRRAIAAMPVPDHGLGHAINDRLRRAAARRPE